MLTNLLLSGGSEEKLAVEDVFSCYLYTGNGSTQTITNGIDLAGKGGLVWGAIRSGTIGTINHVFTDTARGTNPWLRSVSTAAQNTAGNDISSFNSNGFSLQYVSQLLNNPSNSMVSWTFRKAPKFFDVVTYTGNGANSRWINHSLGVAPGMVIIKRTDSTSDWAVNARLSNGDLCGVYLNKTDGTLGNAASSIYWTSTQFDAANYWGSIANTNGASYVAYLFAHDTTADGVIQCGSTTTNGSGNATVTLGWEPQWVLIKATNQAESWIVADVMRGMPSGTSQNFANLTPNSSSAEFNRTYCFPTATGFQFGGSAVSVSESYMYVAIRRGPMRTPTDATKVFSPILNTGGNGSTKTITGIGFAPDAVFGQARNAGFLLNGVIDRLRGVNKWLSMLATDAEGSYTNSISQLNNNSWVVGADSTGSYNYSTYNYISWNFGRAPGFFDVVCFSGAYSSTNYAHNLGVAPEMIVIKKRTGTSSWPVYHIGVPSPLTNQPNLNNNAGYYANNYFSSTPTASVFSTQYLDSGTSNYVAYLFATCPGVSKVGSYTGTGTTQQINCGFTNGARFVLIKRTDSTGDWTVWDSARGIVSGNDPYLLLNSTAAEVTNTDYIDPLSTGFEISSTAPAAINANGGTFVFLAIA